MKLGPTDKRMGFRERGQPLFGPHGIGDDLRAVDGWKQQAEVDPAALRPNLCASVGLGQNLSVFAATATQIQSGIA